MSNDINIDPNTNWHQSDLSIAGVSEKVANWIGEYMANNPVIAQVMNTEGISQLKQTVASTVSNVSESVAQMLPGMSQSPVNGIS